jgi:hypothetical protein
VKATREAGGLRSVDLLKLNRFVHWHGGFIAVTFFVAFCIFGDTIRKLLREFKLR